MNHGIVAWLLHAHQALRHTFPCHIIGSRFTNY
jgi:hypothetical protein